MSLNNVFVIGSGTMGRGIAQQAAASGLNVVLNDISGEQLEKAKKQINSSIQKSIERGRISEDSGKELLSKIKYTTGYEEISDMDIIIEAATEKIDLKKKIFENISSLVSKDTLLASNTSSISITTIASSIENPSRFIGLHFFNPVPVMKLLEVVKGLETSDETIEKAFKFAEKLNKTAVLSKDNAGFIVNRLLIPMLNEACFVLEEGIANKKDIDNAMMLGCNHPIGPLALSDLIGNDVTLAIMDVLYTQTGDSKYRASQLLRRMVDAGQLGRKTKKGFYTY